MRITHGHKFVLQIFLSCSRELPGNEASITFVPLFVQERLEPCHQGSRCTMLMEEKRRFEEQPEEPPWWEMELATTTSLWCCTLAVSG